MTERELKRALGSPCAPTYAPKPAKGARGTYADRDRLRWQLAQWREATGKEQPSCVYEPLLPLNEAGAVMIALKRRKPLELRLMPESVSS